MQKSLQFDINSMVYGHHLYQQSYKSVIKFNGRSILPPLLTDDDINTMRFYKNQALMIEVNNRTKRHQHLIDKVQNVINNVEDKSKNSNEYLKNRKSSIEKDSIMTSYCSNIQTDSTELLSECELKDHVYNIKETFESISPDSGISSKFQEISTHAGLIENTTTPSSSVTLCAENSGNELLSNVSLYDESNSTVVSDDDSDKEVKNNKMNIQRRNSYTLKKPSEILQDCFKNGVVTENMDAERTHSSFDVFEIKKQGEIYDYANSFLELDKFFQFNAETNITNNILSKSLTIKKHCNESKLEEIIDDEENNSLLNDKKHEEHIFKSLKNKTENIRNTLPLTLESNSQLVDEQKETVGKSEADYVSNSNLDYKESPVDRHDSQSCCSESSVDGEKIFPSTLPKQKYCNYSPARPIKLPADDEEVESRKIHLKRYLEEISRMPEPNHNIEISIGQSITDLVHYFNTKINDLDLINSRVNLRQLIDSEYDLVAGFSKSEQICLENSLLDKLKQRLLAMNDNDFVTSTPINSNTPERKIVQNTQEKHTILKPKLDEDELHIRFCKFTALIKGHLTRKLLCTKKVQGLITTIRDTADFALKFHSESINSTPSFCDKLLQERVLSQLTAAMYDIHYLFITSPISERILYIRENDEMVKSLGVPKNKEKVKVSKVSAATLKRRSRMEFRETKFENNNKSINHSKMSNKDDIDGLNMNRKEYYVRNNKKKLIMEIANQTTNLKAIKKKSPLLSSENCNKNLSKKVLKRKVKPTNNMVRHVAKSKP